MPGVGSALAPASVSGPVAYAAGAASRAAGAMTAVTAAAVRARRSFIEKTSRGPKCRCPAQVGCGPSRWGAGWPCDCRYMTGHGRKRLFTQSEMPP
ncbi:hypothetical protein DKG71_25395 [Streptomyces sp. NEAU-S7GS2]|nr:hypothetical protein DKG71_25395 [Streptomyces sp. NEAU-S7GS2]